MATTISLRSFAYRLKNAKSVSPKKPPVPKGIPKELAKKFLRAMQAGDMSKIDDITDEDIIFMLKHGEELGRMIDQNPLLAKDGPLRQRLFEKRSVVKKRIL